MNRVKFRNGIVGLVASTIKEKELTTDTKKLYIDIGASSKEEAEKYLKVGDVAAYVGDYVELKVQYRYKVIYIYFVDKM